MVWCHYLPSRINKSFPLFFFFFYGSYISTICCSFYILRACACGQVGAPNWISPHSLPARSYRLLLLWKYSVNYNSFFLSFEFCHFFNTRTTHAAFEIIKRFPPFCLALFSTWLPLQYKKKKLGASHSRNALLSYCLVLANCWVCIVHLLGFGTTRQDTQQPPLDGGSRHYRWCLS